MNHPAEVLEVTVDPASRRAIAEALGVGAYADLDEVHGWEDRLAWAILAPHQFVTMRRIERARGLLLETGQSVEAIAAAVGFTNSSHFHRLFRRQVGALPAALRAARPG